MRFSLAALASVLLFSSEATCLLPRKNPTNPDVIAHTGNPQGSLQTIQNVTTYITRPRNLLTAWPRRNTAIIYLTDVFGIELPQNKLLADSFARAGYLTIAPDMFQGEALSTDIDLPNFNMGAFLAKHTTAVQDPIIAKAVAWAQAQPNISKVAIAGYCWGGKYAFRFLAAGKGVDAAFSAHPSLLLDSEVTAITKPVSVAYAEADDLLLPARRGELEGLLLGTGKAYQTTLYSGTHHGFAVRADISDDEQRFGKEEAFLQAVRWFDFHL
ncbi:dienelactone hydrolase [Immersiella caudata]|uniref:Dienelactone hydrolase n=1 Tax=Immersiella caudata TaxID=314043 RepID=A0AA39WFS0_9PEZI|nr:dienelactone hydrolase [Immersiella caudata]